MTAPTKPTTRDKTRRRSLFELDDSQIPPPRLPGTPEPVEEAIGRALAARSRLAELQAEARDARAKATAGRRFDALAKEAALDADEPLPKETTPGKEQAAEEAERNAAAAEQHAKQRTSELYDVMQDHHPEYVAALQKVCEDNRSALREHFDALVACYPALERNEELLRLAEGWTNNPASHHLRPTGRDSTAIFDRQYGRALDKARRAARSAPVERQPEVLLATLAVELGVAE